MAPGRPQPDEYAAFYSGYVALVPEEDVVSVLERQMDELGTQLAGVTAEHEQHRYAPGKWSIRQVVGHLGDGERVFGYRLFCFGRGDTVSLPGFDENEYVARATFDERPLAELMDELRLLRGANLHVLRRLRSDDWCRRGTASGNTVSVRALAFVLAGHVRHHAGILSTRYFPGIGAPS